MFSVILTMMHNQWWN